MKRFKKRILPSLLSTLMVAGLTVVSFPQLGDGSLVNTVTAHAASNYGLPSNTEDGLMLHAYRWKFTDIKNTLPQIAEAGYKSIQVSPVQGIKATTGEWWLLYQPTNYAIGNVELGTESDFKALCQEAEKYGIKIIVDVVLNHVAEGNSPGTWSDAVDSSLKRSELYHNQGTINSYQDRYEVTQKNMGGLPDLATQRTDIQDMHINFLNKLIDAGADGFRFDGAKHIETNKGEDAGKSWSGNYWDRVLGNLKNKDSLYLFGEVLPDKGDNEQAYLTYYDITAHGYGGQLRYAVTSKNLTGLGAIWHYDTVLNPSKSFVYVENHDDYENGSSRSLGLWERQMAYSIIAARAQVTTRYFARPFETYWNQPDIVAVNKFHNAMVGENEYLRWTRNETMIIERGTKGMVIVNVGGDTYIDSATNLKDGTYTNKASANTTLYVSNGRITGYVPGGKVIVLYNEETSPTEPSNPTDPVTSETVSFNPSIPVVGKTVTVTYNATNRSLHGSSNVIAHWGYDGWKGVTDTVMTPKGNNVWEVTLTVPSAATSKLDIVFTNGSSWDNNNSNNWSVAVNTGATEETDPVPTTTLSYSPTSPEAGSEITITYYAANRPLEGSSKVIAHWGYDGWKGVTDTVMTSKGNNIWQVTLTVPSAATSKLDIVFTDGTTWDNNNSQDWSIAVKVPEPLPTLSWTLADKKVTIKYNAEGRSLQGSSNVKIHWGYDGWKGVTDTAMTSKGNNLWEVTLDVPSAASSKLDLVFTDGSKWDNNNSQDWSISLK
ncbi:MAG: alpha-amylase [Clostridiales bacterium]|uniref:carbohydrate-binding protein n=1 Tax=Clostridium sp. N3C TaxID=1776758 RepID=UPI00092E0EED|nr:carbohydrate-binding protein [Clostridium sp. N3C]NLZ47734.1 alpha-amylase [Clostridiales bacterium]SCN23454.1 Alpha-amylase precursor [Clostridium sp. N3C]